MMRSWAAVFFILSVTPASAAPQLEMNSCAVFTGKELDTCQRSKKMLQEDYANAWRGDYTAQSNVAFCYETGCDGAVNRNTVQACAWATVVIALGSSDVGPLDAQNAERLCAPLSKAERTAALARAKSILRTVRIRP